MKHSVKLKLKILLAAMVVAGIPLEGSATVPCLFEARRPGSEPAFKFDFSKTECQRIVTRDGSTLTLYVHYPDMKLVGERVLDSELAILRISHVDPQRYDQDRAIAGLTPLKRLDDIDVYGIGSLEVYRFHGKDGVVVFVSDMGNSYVATRLFAQGVSLSYQYSSSHKNVKVMDDAVLSFLTEHLIR